MGLLEVKNLTVEFSTRKGPVYAVNDVSFSVKAGETVGIVGESGSGKSVSSLAIMGLLADNAQVRAGQVLFNGRDLLQMPEKALLNIRGKEIAMIFQDPMTSLNPAYTIGFQLYEVLRIHEGGPNNQIKQRALHLLKQVGISEPEERLNAYPHQLSGGMSQRAMIAMAIACKPKLLIADEPTTALDVTIQQQILFLLKELQKETGMGIIFISHDMGVMAQVSNRVIVMNLGRAVETGLTTDVLSSPRHPYTIGLLESLPSRYGLESFRTRIPVRGELQ